MQQIRTSIKICLIVVGLMVFGYIGLASYVISTAQLQYLIVYAVHGGEFFPSYFARTYFLHSQKIAKEIARAPFPIVPYTLGGIFSIDSISQHRYSFELVDHELKLGANVNAKMNGMTALYGATLLNDRLQVQFLLSRGADKNIKDTPGPLKPIQDAKTPLELALALQAKYPNENRSAVIALLGGVAVKSKKKSDLTPQK
jgi:hypothetical protein